jgi:oligosaccharide repeat unit polymerase
MKGQGIDAVKKQTMFSFMGILLYRIVLDISYYFIISPNWSYAHFKLDINVMKWFESILLLVIVFWLMPKSSKKLSNVMIWLLILFSYVPMLTLFALKNESGIFMYAVTVFWIVVFSLSRLPSLDLTILDNSRTILYSLFVFLGAFSLAMTLKSSGFSIHLDLSKVYEIRSGFSDLKIPLAGYFFSWLCYILNPMFFAIFFIKKKWVCLLLVVYLQLLFFSSTGNRTFLFAFVFVSSLVWVISRKYSLAYIAFGFVGIILLGILSNVLVGDLWISSLFTRRTLLDQPQQYFFYFDFFSKNVSTFLSQHTVFNLFLDYPYVLPPPNLIGQMYYNNPLSNANTGLVGDAYMNFGFAGLVLWSIFLGLFLKIVDSCSNGIDVRIGVAAIAMPVFSMINSALLTCLITHGLVVVCIVLYLFPERVKS